VSHLYAECLLDRTVLLEWYLSFLEASTLDLLPLVYTLATVFWDEIMRLRKLARRFSDILLAKSEQV
jgi:mediator of RNA polymerase II transcription subunit 12